MKRILTLAFVLVSFAAALSAQEYKDSLYRKPAVADSTLAGRDVFDLLRSGNGARVTVSQSSDISSAFASHLATNARKELTGWRIRVYFSNVQSARYESDGVAKTIVRNYPWLGVYRSFERPNFKVAVGDFRTKDEALKLYNELKRIYPEAILIEEKINYPVREPAR